MVKVSVGATVTCRSLDSTGLELENLLQKRFTRVAIKLGLAVGERPQLLSALHRAV